MALSRRAFFICSGIFRLMVFSLIVSLEDGIDNQESNAFAFDNDTVIFYCVTVVSL